MNKLATLFAATMIALSGASLAQDEASPNEGGAAHGQEAQPRAFVLIQRNIYVPVDGEGKVASKNWIVIDKQGVITAEEMEQAAKEASSETSKGGTGGDSEPDQPAQPTQPSAQKRPVGEGPTVRS